MAQKRKPKTKNRSVLWSVLLLLLCIGLLGVIATDPENRLAALLALAFCTVGFVWQLNKSRSAKTETAKSRVYEELERIQAEARAKGAAERANEKRLVYKLRGVTFQGRQKWLEKIYYEEDGFTAPAIELEPYEWEGKPACRVYVCPDNGKKPLDIGNIPAESVAEVLALTDRMTDAYVKVYGGPAYDGDDKSYGAELTIIYK